jgi:hypothetical protein
MLQGKKRSSKIKKEEGVVAFLWCKKEEGDGSVATVAFFVVLRCSTAPQEEEEGDDSCRHLLRCAATQLQKRKKKATIATLPLPSSLRNATPQEEAVAFFATLQSSKTRGRRRQHCCAALQRNKTRGQRKRR